MIQFPYFKARAESRSCVDLKLLPISDWNLMNRLSGIMAGLFIGSYLRSLLMMWDGDMSNNNDESS